jgi:hypothetical protein
MITEYELKNAKPQSKDYTISADSGLFVLVKSTGSKLWRFRYSFAGKRYILSLGKYPTTTIKIAKAKHREYLDQLDKGINPSAQKHIEKAKASTHKNFSEVAVEWYDKRYKTGSLKESKAVLLRINKYLLPKIGKIPMNQIEPSMLFNLIETIQENGSQDKPISLDHAQNYREINKYAIISILTIAKKEIVIFTEKLLESIYSDPLVVDAIAEWLNEDQDRKLKILLKNASNENNMMVFNIKYHIRNKDQVSIRIAEDKYVKIAILMFYVQIIVSINSKLLIRAKKIYKKDTKKLLLCIFLVKMLNR